MRRVPVPLVGLLLAVGALGLVSGCGPDAPAPAPTSKMRVVPEIVEGVLCGPLDAQPTAARADACG